jgi:hypothetical protein
MVKSCGVVSVLPASGGIWAAGTQRFIRLFVIKQSITQRGIASLTKQAVLLAGSRLLDQKDF